MTVLPLAHRMKFAMTTAVSFTRTSIMLHEEQSSKKQFVSKQFYIQCRLITCNTVTLMYMYVRLEPFSTSCNEGCSTFGIKVMVISTSYASTS